MTARKSTSAPATKTTVIKPVGRDEVIAIVKEASASIAQDAAKAAVSLAMAALHETQSAQPGTMVRDEREGRSSERRGRDPQSTSSMERPRIDVWSPANVLETPPDADGYRHRWICEEVNGQSNRSRVAKALREGYIRVNITELSETFALQCDPDSLGGYARFGGLILMKIPLKFVEQRKAHYRKKSIDRQYAVDELQGMAGNNTVIEDRGSRVLEGAEGGRAVQQMSQS